MHVKLVFRLRHGSRCWYCKLRDISRIISAPSNLTSIVVVNVIQISTRCMRRLHGFWSSQIVWQQIVGDVDVFSHATILLRRWPLRTALLDWRSMRWSSHLHVFRHTWYDIWKDLKLNVDWKALYGYRRQPNTTTVEKKICKVSTTDNGWSGLSIQHVKIHRVYTEDSRRHQSLHGRTA